MEPEAIRPYRTTRDVNEMRVMAEHDHLAMRSRCGEHPEERTCTTIVGGDEQIVADNRQGTRAGASFDRAEPKGKV